jgi:ketosteroid isomerase-like protein
MLQEEVELRALAEAAYGALNSGDLEGFLAVVDEDVEFTSLVAEAEGTSFRGHQGVRSWWDTVYRAFEDPRWEVLEVRPSADRSVIKIRMSGTLRGVEVAQTMWQATRVDDGKVCWWAFFRTEEEALEAAGLLSENVKVVRGIWEADRRRDAEAVYAAYAPNIEWEDHAGLWGDWGTARGPDGIRQAWRRWYEAFEDVEMEFGEVAADGDVVVATYQLSARGRGSGVEVELSISLVWTLEAGKVVRIRAYTDRGEALEAAGLPG